MSPEKAPAATIETKNANNGKVDESAEMLFFKCCTICNGDLLLEADNHQASVKCLSCGNTSSVPANTHLFEVLCEEQNCHEPRFHTGSTQAA